MVVLVQNLFLVHIIAFDSILLRGTRTVEKLFLGAILLLGLVVVFAVQWVLHLILVLRLEGRLTVLGLLFYIVVVFSLVNVFLSKAPEVVVHVLGDVVVILLSQISACLSLIFFSIGQFLKHLGLLL